MAVKFNPEKKGMFRKARAYKRRSTRERARGPIATRWPFRTMIERYTIKFGPAVSQKELEKALHENGEIPNHTNLTKVKVRIEVIGDLEDLKKLSLELQRLSKPQE
jgi:hypothetical protein